MWAKSMIPKVGGGGGGGGKLGEEAPRDGNHSGRGEGMAVQTLPH